ncbi:MAG: 4Fe-4S dicluster domain-containing protein [Desulfobulbaceae bacterium]|nr:4Fe-4S dicluster domain-containing protein [Desulfobulbaceae bacterium]
MAKKYAMLIDLRKCVGCTSCQVSCKMENASPMGYYRSKVDIVDIGDYPKPKRYFFPKICNQCDDPPCVPPCPVEATYKREDGVVMIKRDVCIACGACVEACPYGARFLHPYLEGKSASENVADKCDYCSHRLAADIEEPACVRNCMGRARIFGDINDPKSEISKVMAENKTVTWRDDYGTKPMVFFIAPDPKVFQEADGSLNI